MRVFDWFAALIDQQARASEQHEQAWNVPRNWCSGSSCELLTTIYSKIFDINILFDKFAKERKGLVSLYTGYGPAPLPIRPAKPEILSPI